MFQESGSGRPGVCGGYAGPVIWDMGLLGSSEKGPKPAAVGLLTVAASRSMSALERRLRMKRVSKATKKAMAMAPPTAMPAMAPVAREGEDFGVRVYLRVNC